MIKRNEISWQITQITFDTYILTRKYSTKLPWQQISFFSYHANAFNLTLNCTIYYHKNLITFPDVLHKLHESHMKCYNCICRYDSMYTHNSKRSRHVGICPNSNMRRNVFPPDVNSFRGRSKSLFASLFTLLFVWYLKCRFKLVKGKVVVYIYFKFFFS